MILWLHDLLKRYSNLLGFRIQNVILFIAFAFAIYIFKIITITTPLYFFLIPLTIIWTGILNSPYCYLKNIIQLKITSKILKKERYITCLDYINHGDFSLSWNNDGAIGMVVGDLIYLDEEYDFFILWGMKDKIKYFSNFKEFVREEIKARDNQEIIKRKLILKNLTA